ncbi:MAG: hypothetical protein HZY79_15700 [Rhodoblastus sp.]|nr:MAG: hypothetical protein HZY79_15700 [Rhodoblastus sp.]
MTVLSKELRDFSDALLGARLPDADILIDVHAARIFRDMLHEIADRMCKIELDLACLEAVAAEIDPLMLTAAASDATIAETDADLARREAQEERRPPPGALRALSADDPRQKALRGEPSNVVRLPVIPRPVSSDVGEHDAGGAA